ncbi:MotA/TolQ/ExbB proton channel family protein [Actinomycetaceae bacterium L2_0104]
MDPATIIGLLVGFLGIFALMVAEGTHIGSIFLPGPLALVFLGTIGAGLAGGLLKDALGAFRAVPRAITAKGPDPAACIPTIVRLADRARREGLLALEEELRSIEDPFLRQGLSAAIDGTDSEDLRDMLESQIDTKREQDAVSARFFMELGGYAPTIGVVGTVVSLVHVLENLSDVAALGPMIAAAFVATFWGILSANLIWLPLSSRMRRLSTLECSQMQVTVEGIIALQSGANPRIIGERLASLVPPSPSKGEKGKEQAA